MSDDEADDERHRQLQQQMQDQRTEQEQLARKMAEETQARNKMESQLSQMQLLLQQLVDKQTSSAVTSVTTTTPAVICTTSSVSTPIQPSVSDPGLGNCSVEQQFPAESIQVQTSTFSNLTPATFLAWSRSTAYSSIHKFLEGMGFVDFRQKVMVWRKLVMD